MTLADREWRLIQAEARDGPMQMALEEIAAETAASGGPRTVRAYQWSPSTLSMGYRQEAESVDWAFCEHEGIDVTRRQTGAAASTTTSSATSPTASSHPPTSCPAT